MINCCNLSRRTIAFFLRSISTCFSGKHFQLQKNGCTQTADTTNSKRVASLIECAIHCISCEVFNFYTKDGEFICETIENSQPVRKITNEDCRVYRALPSL